MYDTQFKLDMRELEVSANQARSLPAKDLDHPLLGKRIAVKNRPCKGYNGYVRAVRNTSLTVELDALFNSSVSPTQMFTWEDIRILYVHVISLYI
jgi:hypothetical protein